MRWFRLSALSVPMFLFAVGGLVVAPLLGACMLLIAAALLWHEHRGATPRPHRKIETALALWWLALAAGAIAAYWPAGLAAALAWTLAAGLIVRRNYPRLFASP